MRDSISKTIADSEELLQITAREGRSVAEALNKTLSSHLGWPYRVRAGSAKDVDGRATGEFLTLIYTATETEACHRRALLPDGLGTSFLGREGRYANLESLGFPRASKITVPLRP